MRSGSAHCDLELADEVRQFPLRSAAGDDEARGVRRGGGGRRRRTREEKEKEEEEETRARHSDKI